MPRLSSMATTGPDWNDWAAQQVAAQSLQSGPVVAIDDGRGTYVHAVDVPHPASARLLGLFLFHHEAPVRFSPASPPAAPPTRRRRARPVARAHRHRHAAVRGASTALGCAGGYRPPTIASAPCAAREPP